MNDSAIRWKQRFSNFTKAHAQLSDALALMQQRPLSDLEKQGVIQAFEFTYELAWNVLRDYLVWQGSVSIAGARDAIREAYKNGLIGDGHAWMAMLQDRNRTVHTYNKKTADEILDHLVQRYGTLFAELADRFKEIDLSLFDQIDNPELKAQIKQTGQILYCR